jgi:hypothetical protein
MEDELKEKKVNNLNKWKYSLYATIVALIVFNNSTYKLVNNVINVCDKKGCPTEFGFTIHLIVFTIIIRLLM